MKNYTDLEIEEFLTQRDNNFKLTAKRTGINGRLAREELTKINTLSLEERIAYGRRLLYQHQQLQQK